MFVYRMHVFFCVCIYAPHHTISALMLVSVYFIDLRVPWWWVPNERYCMHCLLILGCNTLLIWLKYSSCALRWLLQKAFVLPYFFSYTRSASAACTDYLAWFSSPALLLAPVCQLAICLLTMLPFCYWPSFIFKFVRTLVMSDHGFIALWAPVTRLMLFLALWPALILISLTFQPLITYSILRKLSIPLVRNYLYGG